MAYPFEDDIMGSIFQRGGGRGGGGRPLKCMLRRRGDGQMVAFDPSSGQEAEIVGIDGMGADNYGADDDDGDDFGAEAAINGLDDDLMGADREAKSLLRDAEEVDDDEFGGREERLERKLKRLKSDISDIQDKISKIRGPFANARRNKKQKKLDRKIEEYKEVKAKLDEAQAKREAAKKRARAAVAAAGLAGGAAGLGAAMKGASIASREGQSPGNVNPNLLDPRTAQMIRDAQARAGLAYQVQSANSSGRQTRVSMYQSGSTNPFNSLTIPSGGITSGVVLYSEDLPWATVKIVGFVTNIIQATSDEGATALVEDLKIGGGANLFLNENPHPAANYSGSNNQIPGLRSQPVLRSPNQAQVTIYGTGTQSNVVTLTCDLIVDVLSDDVFGTGLPGPYAG